MTIYCDCAKFLRDAPISQTATRIHQHGRQALAANNNNAQLSNVLPASFVSHVRTMYVHLWFQAPRHRSLFRRAPVTIVTRRTSTDRRRMRSHMSSVTALRAISAAASHYILRHLDRVTCPPWAKRHPRARRAQSWWCTACNRTKSIPTSSSTCSACTAT